MLKKPRPPQRVKRRFTSTFPRTFTPVPFKSQLMMPSPQPHTIDHSRLLTSELVDIYIGPDSVHYPLHERLLTHHSALLARELSSASSPPSSSHPRKFYTLPDEDDQRPFTQLVGWLYSSHLPPPPAHESDLGPLLDLYLLAQKLEIEPLAAAAVDTLSSWYAARPTTCPGLRRVQYVYANTAESDAMRVMLVGCVARWLAQSDGVPAHWAGALKRDAGLALDVIRAIQRQGRISDEAAAAAGIADGKGGSGSGRSSMNRGRGGSGVGVVGDEMGRGESLDTLATTEAGETVDTDMGVRSLGSETEGGDGGATGR